MKERRDVLDNRIPLVVIAVLLVLTAWGNATAMFAAAVVGMAALICVRRTSSRPWLAALAAALLAVVIVAGMN